MTHAAGCHWFLKLAVIGTLSLCGCPAKTHTAKPAAPTPPATETIPIVAETTATTPTEAAPAPNESDTSPSTASTETAITSPTPPPAPESKERILLLTANSPIIIDFVLTIDGAPHTAALNKLVDEVLKLADTDGDGRTMWKELCECDRIKYGQFGNLPINDENSEKQVIERYDIARDGVVDRSELPRFLTRNAGGSRPFSIRGTLNHRGSNRHGSATWRVIDADGNGLIDADERRTAAVRLAGRDDDDDEIVTAADLNPRLQIPDPDMMLNDRRRRGPDASRLLGEHADWSSVQRALEQEYSGGRVLRADNSPFSAETFQKLDANHDGRLLRAEFERLNDLPAQIIVEVAFGNDLTPAEETATDPTEAEDEAKEATNPLGNQPQLKLRYFASELEGPSDSGRARLLPSRESSGNLTLSIGDTILTFTTNDTVARRNFAAQAKQSLAMFDQNKDGYLEASEVPETPQGQIGRFEAIDADGDGKAYPQEIEAFLAQQQAALRAQIHARAGDVEDLLFVALDANHDGRLDSREIQHAAERLAELDANGDGELSPAELPEALSIVLARGSIENAETLFTPSPTRRARPDKKTPRWFTAMDANQDGVVSRREFLGTNKQFAELDQDQNGIVEVGEVVK